MQPRTKALIQLIAIWIGSVIGWQIFEDRGPFMLTVSMLAIFTIPFLAGINVRQWMRKYFLIVALVESVPAIVLYFTVASVTSYIIIYVVMVVWQRYLLSLYNENWGKYWPFY